MSYDEWARAYTSTSIVDAYNKTSEFKLPAANLEWELRYSVFGNPDYPDVAVASDSERHRAMVKNVSEYVAAAGGDELVIVQVGAAHAVEIALSGSLDGRSILYSFAPLRQESTFVDIFSEIRKIFESERNPGNSAAIDRAEQRLRGIFPRQTSAVTGEMVIGVIKALAHVSLADAHTEPQYADFRRRLFEGPAVNLRPQAIVFADIHGLNQSSQISSLPVTEIVNLGFKKVTFLLEPFPADSSIEVDRVDSHARLSPQLAEDKPLLEFASRLSPGLKSKLLSSDLVVSPAKVEIANLARAFQEAGILVELRGVEAAGAVEAALAEEANEAISRASSDETCRGLLRP